MDWLLTAPMFATGSVWRLVDTRLLRVAGDRVQLVFQLVDERNPTIMVTLYVFLITFRVEVNNTG